MNPRTRRRRRQHRKHNRTSRLEPVIAKAAFSFCSPRGHDYNYGLTHTIRMRWVPSHAHRLLGRRTSR